MSENGGTWSGARRAANEPSPGGDDAEQDGDEQHHQGTDALLTGDAFGDFLAEQDHSVDVALQTLGVG